MNGIKGYISIREASYRWGVSERRKTRKSRPTRAFRNSAAIPAGEAPDGYPSAFEASAKRK